jgi:predicted nucleic acid-binding Zn ribbon protein
VERVVSRPAIQFKGSGWYVTDYARSSSSGSSESAANKEGTAATGTDAQSKPKVGPAPKEKKTTAEK